MTDDEHPHLRVVPDPPPPKKLKLKRKRKGLGEVTTSARRDRARSVRPDEAARMLLGAANVAAGALDLFGRMAAGEGFLVAARKAVRGAKKRGAAIEGATEDEDEEPER